MRVVPLFIAIALLGCVFAEQAPEVKAKRDLAATVQKAGDAMAKIQLKSPLGVRAIPQEAHLFKAQQSATCDQAAFADATARALQACPSLSGLVSGTTTLVEFLPGFCGSDCHKTLAAELPKHVGCLDSMSSASFLLGFIQGCQYRPRCFSEAFVKTQDSLGKRCGAQIDAVTNFKNFTAAAITDTRAACTGTCVTEMAAMMRSYPECIQDEDGTTLPAASMASLMEGLCQQENNEYCAVRMKGIGKLSCSDYSTCYAANSWCEYSYYTSCVPAATEDRLYSFCGSCVANLQKNAAAFGDDADTLVSSLNLFCSTVNGGAHVNGTNPYCYPQAMTAITRLSSYTGLNYASNATVGGYCAGNASRCVDRLVSITADIATSAAKKSFVSCLSSYSSGSSYCRSVYESSLRSAADTRATGAVLCAQNDNNDWCLARLGVVYYYQTYCGWYGSSSSYRTNLQSAIANAGCCMSYYNEYNRYDYDSYAASYLPAGTRVQPYTYYYTGTTRYYTYTHDSRYTRSAIYRNEQPANDLFSCLSTTANTTDFWAPLETSCSTWLASPPTSSVPVMISWTRLNRNAAVKKAIAQALRTDVANTIGVAAGDILNFTLVENAAATIYLRNESTLTRRQAQTTDHGATFQFAVDQPTSADATAAIARLTSAVSAGTFVTPSTSAAVQTQCGECVDARSDLLVKSAETPVAPVMTSPPNDSSSASTVAVASAIAAAFALLAAL